MPCNCPDCTAAARGAAESSEPVCAGCGYSPCECPRCEACGVIATATLCRSCYRCAGCCTCNIVPYMDPVLTFHGTPTPRYPRYLGIEIECVLPGRISTSEYQALATRWGAGITSDGSIRADSGQGVEHVTAPARGDAFVTQVNETCAALHSYGAEVNKSCGLHVHVDARDYTTRDVLALARLYSRVEKTLYTLVSKARKTNTFSEPWGDKLTDARHTTEGVLSPMDDTQPITAREKALDIATYGDEAHAKRCKSQRYKDHSRYHGLNFNALACHSTVEFRLHHGTTNATKIIMWAAVCAALVEYAKTHTEGEIKALRGTPAEILTKVTNDPQIARWCNKRRIHFEGLDRQRRGLAPRARARAAAPEPVPEIPDMPTEGGEDPRERGRVGRRAV